VRVLGQEQRAGDALPGPVLHDGLGDGNDVLLVERRLQAGAAVPGRAERHSLAGITKIRCDVVIRVKKRSDVNKVLGLGNCARAASHATSMPDGGRSQNDLSGMRPLCPGL
jgi:hypothetical protein